MPAGLGGSGYMALTFETAVGTYLPPTTGGTVFIPILDESVAYQEEKYLARQIRQTTIAHDAKPSYYSVSGDVTLEVDPTFLPHLLYCSRHTIAKTGAGPFEYTFTPSSAGSTSTAASGTVQRTCSLAFIRNGVGFGYAGCTLGGYEFTIEDGTLRMTAHVVGMSEVTPAGLGTPTWTAPNLYGAADNAIYIAAAAISPTFGAADVAHNGFTFSSNFNAEPQNRIRTDRSASYVSFGETEATYDTELDFLDKAEYDLYKATTFRALRSLSTHGGATFAAATDAVEITINNSFYETYEVNLGGIGDLIMAGVTGHVIGIAGGNPYQIKVKSAVTIT